LENGLAARAHSVVSASLVQLEAQSARSQDRLVSLGYERVNELSQGWGNREEAINGLTELANELLQRAGEP